MNYSALQVLYLDLMSIEYGNRQNEFQVKITLSKETIEIVDKLKMEYGVKTRGRVIEMLLQDLIAPEE